MRRGRANKEQDEEDENEDTLPSPVGEVKCRSTYNKHVTAVSKRSRKKRSRSAKRKNKKKPSGRKKTTLAKKS